MGFGSSKSVIKEDIPHRDGSDENIEESKHRDYKSIEYKSVDLKNKITMRLPKALLTNIQNICSKPWTVDRRLNSPEKDIQNMEMFCTDIYELAYINEAVTENRRDGDIFYVPDSNLNHITVRIPIINTEKGTWFDYQARILSRNAWKRVDAIYVQDNRSHCVKFNANSIDSFCITRTPKKEKRTITKDGHTFTSEKDSRVQVTFPPGAVDTEEEMQFVLFPTKTRKPDPKKFNILAMSDCLYIYQSLPRFNCPVSLNLPINENVDDSELVFFHWKNNKMDTIDHSPDGKMEKTNDRCTLSVDSFSGYCAALIRNGTLASITQTDVDLHRGLLKRCKILIFREKKVHDGYISLWVEIVDIDKVEETVRRRIDALTDLIEMPSCRSSDVFLKDEQRIRIAVSGRVRFPQARQKSAHTFTFLHTATESFMSFPVQLVGGMHTAPYAQIEFLDDRGKNYRLHNAHFFPDQFSTAQAHVPRLNLAAQGHRHISHPQPLLSNEVTEVESASSDNRDFYTERSMIWLAKALPAKDSYQFAIFLGINREDINRIKIATKDDLIEYHMELLKKWKDSDTSANKIDVLTKALKDCDLNNIAHDVKKAYRKGRMLNRDDFK